MNMTKRDVADIVLVGMAVSFLMSLLTAILSLGTIVGMTTGAEAYCKRSVALTFQILHVVALLFLNYVLLFKRSIILSLVFPDGRDKEVSIPSGLVILASYSFWIRLLGIFVLLSSGVHFLSRLVMDLAATPQFGVPRFWMQSCGSEFVSTVMGAIVVWKADWIAEKLGNKGSSNEPSAVTSASAPNADDSAHQG